MKTFFPLLAFLVVAFSLFQSYKESKIAVRQKQKQQALVSTKTQSSENSQFYEAPVQDSAQKSHSPEIIANKSENTSVPEMNVELTALDALDAFQKAIAEHQGSIENSDIIDTTVNNIRGYIAAEEEL